MREMRSFFLNCAVTGASLPPLKTNKCICHAGNMTYFGGYKFLFSASIRFSILMLSIEMVSEKDGLASGKKGDYILLICI